MPEDAMVAIRKSIEDRVSEQLARHALVNPSMDPKDVVDIQMQQEQERLHAAILGAESQASIDACKALLEWLPELARSLKARDR